MIILGGNGFVKQVPVYVVMSSFIHNAPSYRGMESEKISDFFFPASGMIAYVLGHLKIRIGSYRQTKDIMAIFKWKLKIVP